MMCQSCRSCVLLFQDWEGRGGKLQAVAWARLIGEGDVFLQVQGGGGVCHCEARGRAGVQRCSSALHTAKNCPSRLYADESPAASELPAPGVSYTLKYGCSEDCL